MSVCSGLVFVAISTRDSFTADFLVFWPLPAFHPPLLRVPSAIDAGTVVQVYLMRLGSPPSVDLCVTSRLVFCDVSICRKRAFDEGGSYTYLWL